MADIPVQRSYEQILSDIVDSFIARTGISSLKVGSPLLSMMEAVAQSQFRNTADGFKLLSSSSLDYAVGDALTQIAADEGLTRRNAASSFGYVTFTDKSYTKISTLLKEQTVAGSFDVKVTGTTGFIEPKQVRIGSDTYTISAVNGDTITFASALSKLYPVGTEVVQLSGTGDKTIPAGTSVGTGTLNFVTTNTATILDGETSVANVSVVCSTTGTSTNVPAKSINQINSTLSFTASVVNPLGFVNGQDQETDDELRDRVRAARRDKQRGTTASIENAVIGAYAADESKRVVSSNLVDTGTGKATLYIDDGTGYEGITSPIGIETLTASAVGGEKYFELQGGRPVAQCFVESGVTFPADLSDGASFTVKVENNTAESFTVVSGEAFAQPSTATSYELVSYINRKSIDDGLKFKAVTRSNHTKVALIPKEDDANTITVTVSSDSLAFPTYPVSTLYLFRNGVIQVEGTDYTLNRSKGQIFLNQELTQGESLVVGSMDVRARVSTSTIPTNSTATGQYLWFVADDSVEKIFDKENLFISQSLGTDLVTFQCFAGFGGATDGDWLIAWSDATARYWTKRIEDVPAFNQVVVRGTSTLGSISGFSIFRFSDPDTVPQKLAVPLYSIVDSLVSSLNDGVNNALARDIHTVRVAGLDRIQFVTNSFGPQGSLYFLNGTAPTVESFGLQWSAELNVNPSNYQTSLVSVPDTNTIDTAAQTILWPNPYDIGRIVVFSEGQQKGLRATQYDTTEYRSQLDESISTTVFPTTTVQYEKVDTYSGFHISDTDSLVVKLENDANKVYTVPLAIEAKINGTTLTDPQGIPLTFASQYLFNDWAIWSATSQKETISTDGGDLTFTSKLFGPSNPIERVDIVYPQVYNQGFKYLVTNNGKMSVVLASGSEITPDSMDANQIFWLGNFNSGPKTIDLVGRFDGLGARSGVPLTTTIDVYVVDGYGYGFYPYIKQILNNGAWVCVYNKDTNAFIGNLRITDVDEITNPQLVTITLEDNEPLMPTGSTNVVFSISNSQSATTLASFDGMSSGSYVNNSTYKNTYRINSSGGFDKVVLKCGSDIHDQMTKWTGANIKFFAPVLDQPVVVDNPYFTITPTTRLVARSTEEYYNFSVPSGEGVIPTAGRVNYVKTSTPTAISPKKSQTYTDESVKLVPITSQNVADCLSFALNGNGVLATASSGGVVELCRYEAGSSASIEVTGGTANSAAAVSAVLDGGGNFCSVVTTSVTPFVEGFWVRIEDSVHTEEAKIQKVVAGLDDNIRYIYFTSSVPDANLFDKNATKITALNKLGFPENDPATNSDGYKYYAGLIGEANRIVYGDAADPANYGGYASANANIEVVGPQVKQIQMSIYVKMSGGFTVTDAKAAVRNAASAVVNSTPVGQSVAYSDVVAAVNAIPGVFSVAIANFTTENPTIPVLAFEKPLIIDLEKDIQVEIAGI